PELAMLLPDFSVRSMRLIAEPAGADCVLKMRTASLPLMVTLAALGPSIVTAAVMAISLASVIVRGVLKYDEKTIVSAPEWLLASSTACRSEPAPALESLSTVNVAGASRLSRSRRRSGRLHGRLVRRIDIVAPIWSAIARNDIVPSAQTLRRDGEQPFRGCGI